jgi:ATP-dependent Clp protease, protease subunit
MAIFGTWKKLRLYWRKKLTNAMDNQPPSPPQPPVRPGPPAPPAPPAGPKTIYINYFDIITDAKIKVLMAVCSELLAKQKPDVLYFLFSSNGGNVNAGITFYNFLKALPVEIVMHNTGSIDSIATVIFMAGTKRYASKHSTFLFHGIASQFEGKISLDRSKYQELLSGIVQEENKIAGIIAGTTKLSEEEIRKLFLQGESKDLTFAMDKGVIQEVKDATIPKDAVIISLNIN